MKPFIELTYSGQIKRLKRLAESALLDYNLGQVHLRCLAHGENTTFKVEILNPTIKNTNICYVLRIYRPGKNDYASINSELTWLCDLRQQTNLPVSEPINKRDGSLIVTTQAPGVPEPRYCALFRWLPGKFRDAGLNTKAMSSVGIFLAKLHHQSQNFIPPKGFVRPRFDRSGLFGQFPISFPVESSSFISHNHQTVLETAAKKIQQQMGDLNEKPENFGLIHGDLNFGNLKFHQGEIQVFDFDDCGWGYYIYDIAVTLFYLRKRTDFQTLRSALLESYQSIRAIPREHEFCIDALIAARRLHLLRELFQRQDNPKLRELIPDYLENSVQEMTDFLNKT